MKKLLIPICVLFSLALQAQQATAPMVTNEHLNFETSPEGALIPSKIELGSNKKKRSDPRWYDIVDAVDKSTLSSGIIYTNPNYNQIWSDSTMLAPFGSPATYSGVWIKSVMAVFDPVDPRFNDVVQYPAETAVTNSNAYSIDSLFIPFVYTRNAAKTSVVDTLIVSVIQSDGQGSNNDLDIRFYGPTSTTSVNHGTDTLRFLHGFMDLNPSSANQHTFIASSPSVVVNQKIPLTVSTLNDTTGNGFNFVQIPVNLNVPAGNKVAASIVFKSGDTWTPNADTVYISGSFSTPKFNNFRFVAFEEFSGAHQVYTKGVWSQASIMRNDTSGWGNWHIPSYAFTNTSYEHQWFQWLVNCPTCLHVGTDDFSSSISKLSIYPNPAKSNTTISFTVEEPLHNAQVQLINLSGVVISSTDLGFVERNSSIKEEISTSGIAAGMYFMQLTADEGKRTEKIVIQ